MNSAFGRRCEAALIHPVTVAALAVLLLNDLVLKSVWPDSWVTGKLSDLAWVVFALPLLAFLLSLVVGRSDVAHRVAFIASYVGLPLLYAAYNTFEPVYDWIIRGLSFASGGTAGSPQDVTDSLVIPLGLGIAVWVWRRFGGRGERPRLRWAPLMAGLAALASVATVCQPEVGITKVAVAEDGIVYAGTVYAGTREYTTYRSLDGGVNWEPGSTERVQWGGQSAETPAGTYTISGSDIVLLGPDGESRMEYASSYLREEPNLWAQKRSTAQLGFREIATEPLSIVYDERTGNVIAAMGIQGIVVGASDGEWTRYGVGPYTPTDFSFAAKWRLLLSSIGFWAASLALSLSMTGVALVLSPYRKADLPLLGGVLVGFLAVISLPFALFAMGWDAIVNYGLGLSLVAMLVLIGVSIVLGIVSNDTRVQKGAGLVVAVSSVVASCLLVRSVGVPDIEDIGLLGFSAPLFALIPVVLGCSTLAIARPALRQWPAVLAAMLFMNAAVVLAFLLWLRVDITLARAQASSVAVVALAGLVLLGYLKRHRQSPSQPVY